MKSEEPLQYQGVTTNWISGHTPELHVFTESGDLLEKVDITTYDFDSLHGLLVEKGFQKKISSHDDQEMNDDDDDDEAGVRIIEENEDANL